MSSDSRSLSGLVNTQIVRLLKSTASRMTRFMALSPVGSPTSDTITIMLFVFFLMYSSTRSWVTRFIRGSSLAKWAPGRSTKVRVVSSGPGAERLKVLCNDENRLQRSHAARLHNITRFVAGKLPGIQKTVSKSQKTRPSLETLSICGKIPICLLGLYHLVFYFVTVFRAMLSYELLLEKRFELIQIFRAMAFDRCEVFSSLHLTSSSVVYLNRLHYKAVLLTHYVKLRTTARLHPYATLFE